MQNPNEDIENSRNQRIILCIGGMMGYFNYHAKAKQLIREGHLVDKQIVDNWNGIKPALVLYFDNNRPMPIREHRWSEYI